MEENLFVWFKCHIERKWKLRCKNSLSNKQYQILYHITQPFFICHTHSTSLYEIHSESKMENVEPTGAGTSFGYTSVKFCLSRGSNLKRNKLPKAWPNTDKWGVKWGVKAQYSLFFTTSSQFLLSQLPKFDTLNTSNGITISLYSVWNRAYLLRGCSVVRAHNLFFAVPLFTYAD